MREQFKFGLLAIATIGLVAFTSYAAPPTTALDPGGGQAVQAVANGTGTATDINIITAFDLDSNATAITSTPSDTFAQNNTVANKTMATTINTSLPTILAAIIQENDNANQTTATITAPIIQKESCFGTELATATAITANGSPPDAIVANSLANEITATTVTGSRIANLNTETSGYTDVANANTTSHALVVDVTACARSCPNFAAVTFTDNHSARMEVSIAPTGGGSFGANLVATSSPTGTAFNTG